MITAKTLRMPEELALILKERAKKDGFTLNGLIVKILWDYVKEKQK